MEDHKPEDLLLVVFCHPCSRIKRVNTLCKIRAEGNNLFFVLFFELKFYEF